MELFSSSEMVSGRYGGTNITRTHRNIMLFEPGVSCSYNFQDKHRLFPKQNETFGIFNGVKMRQFDFTVS
jgi:hypothetical protein